jgi:hypothetical protein
MEQLRGVVEQSVQMSSDLQSSAEGLDQQSDVLQSVAGKFRLAAIAGNPMYGNGSLIEGGDVVGSRQPGIFEITKLYEPRGTRGSR